MSVQFKIIQVFDQPEKAYRGNVAAVLMLHELPDEEAMQAIAADLAQPATTFLAPAPVHGEFLIRWFAPDGEIGLCGHGALAAVAFLQDHAYSAELKLHYSNGLVKGNGLGQNMAEIGLPAIEITGTEEPDQALTEGLGVPIKSYHPSGNKDIVVLESERDLVRMSPDFARLRDRQTFGYAVTAPGERTDFVSRTLVPFVSQLEDHATGSSHALLTPFWARKLSREDLTAEQLSPRKGSFSCHFDERNNEVWLKGHFKILASGEMSL